MQQKASTGMEQWQWNDAKGKFVELLQLSHTEGPQMVVRKGEEAVVIVSASEFSRLSGNLPSSVALLLNAPRGQVVPPLQSYVLRQPAAKAEQGG